MVGGSTRIPAVQELVKKLAGKVRRCVCVCVCVGGGFFSFLFVLLFFSAEDERAERTKNEFFPP